MYVRPPFGVCLSVFSKTLFTTCASYMEMLKHAVARLKRVVPQAAETALNDLLRVVY